MIIFLMFVVHLQVTILNLDSGLFHLDPVHLWGIQRVAHWNNDVEEIYRYAASVNKPSEMI